MLRYAVIMAVAISATTAFSLFGRDQSIAVRGQVRCGDKPADGLLVKLVDIDRGGPDDEMDSGTTDRSGNFELSGFLNELSTIDPVLKIYHDCNDHGMPCQRKWEITIPDEYVSRGRKPGKTFYFGTVNLEVELDGEERDCIH